MNKDVGFDIISELRVSDLVHADSVAKAIEAGCEVSRFTEVAASNS